MSQLESQAEVLNARQDALMSEVRQVLAEAGSHLLKTPEQIESVDLGDIRTRDREVTEQIEQTESDRDRIRAIVVELAELKEREAELRSATRELSENMDPIYEEIGRLAFEVYRNNPLVDQQYADIFGPLVEVNSELNGTDAAIAEQEGMLEAKPFLEKMVVRGRIALLRNRRTTREGSFRRLVRNAGREIMGTGFVEEIGDPALSRAAEPYVERMQRTRANEEQIEKSDNRRRKLAAELETLNASRRTERRISELEEDLETLVTSRRAIRAELAAAVRDSGSAGIPAAVVSLFEQTTGLEDQLQKISAVSERIAAGIEVERLNRAVAQLDRDIQVRESRQAEIKSELSDLRKSKRATESKLEEQMAIRGSMDDLLSPELLENL